MEAALTQVLQGVAAPIGNISVAGGYIAGSAYDIGVEAGTDLNSGTTTAGCNISVTAAGKLVAVAETNSPATTAIAATALPVAVSGGSSVHAVYQQNPAVSVTDASKTTIPLATMTNPSAYTWSQSSNYVINSHLGTAIVASPAKSIGTVKSSINLNVTGSYNDIISNVENLSMLYLNGSFAPMTAVTASTDAALAVALSAKQNAGSIELRAYKDGTQPIANAQINLASAADNYTVDFNVNVKTDATVTALKFLVQPKSTTTNTVINAFSVQALNQYGNPVYNVSVLLSGATFAKGGQSAYTNENGVASFSGRTIAKAGTYTLTAKVGAAIVKSNSFTIKNVNPATNDSRNCGFIMFFVATALIAVSLVLKKISAN